MPLLRSEIAESLYRQFAAQVTVVPQKPKEDRLQRVVLHISEGCNLACSYCFADRGQYGASHSRFMSPAMARESVFKLFQKYKRVDIIKLFGGEPFLNFRAVKAATEAIAELESSGRLTHRPRFVAVSNLTIFSSEIVEWINAVKPIITASLDGPAPLHNAFRVFPDGRGSFDLVSKNIHRYKAETNQPAALECVFTPQHFTSGFSPEDIHKWMSNEFGIKEIFVHPMGRVGSGTESIDPDVWSQYVTSMYDMARDYGQFLIANAEMDCDWYRIFEHAEALFYPQQADAHCDLGVDQLAVTAAGDVYPCYTLIGKNEFVMGSVAEGYAGPRFDAVQQLFVNNKKSTNPVCASCSIQTTCRSCPGEMEMINSAINKPVSVSCEYLVGFVEGQLLGLNNMRAHRESWNQFGKFLSSKLDRSPDEQSHRACA